MEELENEAHLLALLVTTLDPSISYRQAGAIIFDALYYMEEDEEETIIELGKALLKLKDTAQGDDEAFH